MRLPTAGTIPRFHLETASWPAAVALLLLFVLDPGQSSSEELWPYTRTLHYT